MKGKKILNIVLIFVFIIVFLVCSYFLLKDINELNKNKETIKNLIEESIETNEETKEKLIDWKYLKSVNEDVIAWIEINDTNINYPILKDKGNYYLRHLANKEYNINGSIFTTNANPFEDAETIIYGHNMKNGSMFSNIGKYMNKKFAYTHNKFKIYTPKCNYEAVIFSVYSIGIEDEINNLKGLNFNERINYYKSASKYNFQSDNKIDKIVKLSTCSYINAKETPTEQRYYIIAMLYNI